MRRHLPALPLLLVPAFLALAAPPSPSAAQEPRVVIEIPPEGAVQELLLRDGSTLYGRVVATGDPFRFQLVSGQTLEISRADVEMLRVSRGRVVEGRFWRSDPNRTRLFFGPTGRTVPKGEGYLSVFEIVFPILALGLTDQITLAGGTPFFFGDWGSRPFWFAPKVGLYATEELAVAAGVLAFFVSGSDDSFGLLYGAASVGKPDRGIHLGVGYGYADGELASRPALMFGAELRVAPAMKLLTENYMFPSEGGIVSGGVRFFGERLSADLGLATPVGTGSSSIAFPVVNFVWNF